MAIVITKQPVNAVGVLGNTVYFVVEATGVSAYQWQYRVANGTTWLDFTSKTEKVFALALSTEARLTHYYRCLLSDADGNTLATDEVRVIAPDIFLIQPDSLTAIADAVRGVTGGTTSLTPSGMAEEVAGLSKIIHGTEDLEEGVSALTTGVYYFYEQSE